MAKENYQELVYDLVRLIPKGRVSSYGAIADYLALGSARMVGWAMYNVQPQDEVPAHRVVNSKGALSGRDHFRPPGLMQQLLEAEGVKVENDRVVDFKTVFWHPQELGW